MTATLTPRERELARHALGLDGRRKCTYRNHYGLYPGGNDHSTWLGLVECGLAMRRASVSFHGGADHFWLTRAGALAALETGEMLDEEDFPG